MIDIENNERRRVFARWLRTGRLPTVSDDGIELKFNPYHDPRDGRFTFAPGGSRSVSRVVISHRKPRYGTPGVVRAADRMSSHSPDRQGERSILPFEEKPRIADTVLPVDNQRVLPLPARFGRIPRAPRGSNSRAFEDPMLLEQAFPGLRDAPGGAIIAAADSISTSRVRGEKRSAHIC